MARKNATQSGMFSRIQFISVSTSYRLIPVSAYRPDMSRMTANALGIAGGTGEAQGMRGRVEVLGLPYD
jgi:hypothetical protein